MKVVVSEEADNRKMSVADVALSSIGGAESVRRYLSGLNLAPVGGESIVIYLTLAGSVTPMRVLDSDSIGSVKLRIQSEKGFVAKKQKLVFGGRELARTDSLIKDYGISSGNVLHLVVKVSDLVMITVKTTCGSEFDFRVDRHRNVGYLKRLIAKKEHGEKGFDTNDVEDQEVFHNGEKLDEDRLINEVCNYGDGMLHFVVQKSAKVWAKPVEKDLELSIVAPNWDEVSSDEKKEQPRELHVISRKPPDKNAVDLEPVIGNAGVKIPPVLQDMIDSVFKGLEKGIPPVRSSDGTGGAYFMQDASGDKIIAVFKPIDEEPMAVNNPNGLPLSLNGEGLKSGTRVGEGALREVAAYILDHPKNGSRWLSNWEPGFAGVPPTVMIQCSHKEFNYSKGFDSTKKKVKMGSLQMFMANHGSCEDMGPQSFPVEEVHKISVLDIRTANADRHAGNILMSKGEQGQISLIPIDHGYCLPENFEDCTFDWLYWPQARQPYSQETISYINSLDAEMDIRLLQFHGWNLSLECARTLRISTMLLKKGAEKGLTPFTIGSVMCRETIKKKAVIEDIVREAQESMLPGMAESAFLETVSEVMDIHLDKLIKSPL
ncbi:OLC1v1030052C1 [Oldenlandia corymbosa var. corymbosa]|uniref:1-phosphatidylinositol 4-kinase n=1 Tax=Oldenlandia corymbosa var. corymbosa TaxID=529605 RepID=A0AAV1CI87_OLDCO|nr:OLC1v1030052C1 [Oldenlandia corymbosa var. corymbosa]